MATNYTNGKRTMLLILSLVIFAAIILVPLATAPNIIGPNYRNVTVWTHVNITNSKPEVLNITIYETTTPTNKNITISAGSLKSVTCNATVRDWNGFNDIVYVNATLYYINNQSFNPDDNNTHYTNASCTLNSSTGTYTGLYQCIFPNVQYYANNGTWYCTVTDQDTYNKTGNFTSNTTFYPVYALNVTDGIDYGNVAVEDFSNETAANITNFGNMPINVSVEGYGVNRGDGLAMNCSINSNITVNNEHFALTSGIAYGAKTVLTSAPQLLSGLTMPKQTLSSTQIVNSTYWQLYIPPNPAGNCTGWIIFMAQTP